MTKKILVLGATGFIGTPLTKQLQKDGFNLRVLVRQPAKAKQFFGERVEIIAGDVQDPAALTRALAGVDGVSLNVPWKMERSVARQVVEILAAQGRKDVHILYLSGVTVIPENRWFPMIDEKAQAEELLEQSGLPYTIFKPSWFMEALQLFVRDGRATLFGKQNLPYNFVAMADYVRLVSKAFQTEAARFQKITVNGPEALLMMDALQKYCDAVHPGLKASSMPIWFGNMLGVLTGSAELKETVAMMAYFEKVQRVAPESGIAILGSPVLTLQEWLKSQKMPSRL